MLCRLTVAAMVAAAVELAITHEQVVSEINARAETFRDNLSEKAGSHFYNRAFRWS